MRMEKEKDRGNIFASTVVSPGPGAYDPLPPLDAPKRWTVKLRKVKPIPVLPRDHGKTKRKRADSADAAKKKGRDNGPWKPCGRKGLFSVAGVLGQKPPTRKSVAKPRLAALPGSIKHRI
jgi:hypothetical protein